MDQELSEQRGLLEDREASAAEASAKLQRILVAALAAQKKADGKLAASDLRHRNELITQAKEYQKQLGQKERDLESKERVNAAALRQSSRRKTNANTVLDQAVEKMAGQLDEAAKRRGNRPGGGRSRRGQARRGRRRSSRSCGRRRPRPSSAPRTWSGRRRPASRTANFWMKRIREAVDKVAIAMEDLSLEPAKRTKDYLHDRLEDHARFLDSLSEQLPGLRKSCEEHLKAEGEQLSLRVATHILSHVHHLDPAFPIDAIHRRITPPEKKREAKAAVAAHVDEFMKKMARRTQHPRARRYPRQAPPPPPQS